MRKARTGGLALICLSALVTALTVLVQRPGEVADVQAGAAPSREAKKDSVPIAATAASSTERVAVLMPQLAASHANRSRTREDELRDFELRVLDPPNVLVNLVHAALQEQDGAKAMVLAVQVGVCSRADAVVAQAYERQSGIEGDKHQKRAGLAMLSFTQKLQAQCQTLGNEAPALRLALLKVATEQGVMGAAAKQYVHSYDQLNGAAPAPALLAQIARDALAGDAFAADLIARSRAVPAGAQLQETLRRALAIAAADPENQGWASMVLQPSRAGDAATPATFTDAQNQRMDEQARVVAGAFKRYELSRFNRP